jgi:hypothetical protein
MIAGVEGHISPVMLRAELLAGLGRLSHILKGLFEPVGVLG